MTVHALSDPAGLAALPSGPIPPLTREAWALTRPDLHFAAVDRQRLMARASVWWSQTPTYPERPVVRVGMIGHLVGDGEALALIMQTALDALRDNGMSRAIAPMDGSPWHAYRAVSDPAPDGDEHPPFALEPSPQPEISEGLVAAGFEPVEQYHSALVPHLPDRADALRQRLAAAADEGVRLRPFDPARAEVVLDAIYRISLASFARNPFYVPISREAFLATYRPLLGAMDPRLVLLAEREGEVVGVCFGLPDLAQSARGETVNTVIVKTVAVAPEAGGRGLGSLLVLAVEEAARRAGLSRSIHALMHDGNRSVRISRQRDVRIIRRYALLGRDL